MRLNNLLKKHTSGTILIFILSISLISMSVSVNRFDFKPREIGSAFFSLFQISFSKITRFIGDTVNSIGELKKLKTEYEVLREKVTDYQILQRDIIELKLENQRLREQLGYTETISEHFISAQIIAQEPGDLFKTLVSDKGLKDGIRKNMPVIAFQNGFQGLVGRTLDVTAFSSKILPVFSKNSYVGARMLTNRFEGLVNGEGNKYGFLTMNYVKKRAKENIKFGDIVVTSGMKSIYPRGIYIGRVREMDTTEWQSSLQLKLEPIIDFSRLEYVFILTGEDK